MRAIAKVFEPVSSEFDAPRNGNISAVLITHGMGQQVKWETLSLLAGALDRAGLLEPGIEPGVRQVQFTEGRTPFFLGRAEFTLRPGVADPDAPPKRVHVYEAYWAPLTEGKISLTQTMAFLWDAAINGIILATRKFFRYGRFEPPQGEQPKPPIKAFPGSYRMILWFVMAMAVVGALTVMNASITLTALRELTTNIDVNAPQQEPARRLLTALTADLTAFELAVLVYGLVAGLAMWYRARLRHRDSDAALPGAVRHGLWAVTLLLFAVTVGAGLVAIPWHYAVYWAGSARGLFAVEQVLADVVQSAVRRLPLLGHFNPLYVHAVAVWGLLILVFIKARGLVVQYIGDVAIYVSHHTVSTFDETRDAIKALVRRTLCAIVEQGGYERVVVVGHSLGSVIAYDALNGGMLAADLREPPKEEPSALLQVLGAVPAQRNVDAYRSVRRLITFGSPLDKTAFVFRSAGRQDAAIREGLAATVQPLLVHPPSRAFDWVNIWSRSDIISGKLDLYPGVRNEQDAQADVPVVAHTQFWSNSALARCLHEACVDAFVPLPVARAYEDDGQSAAFVEV